MTPRIAAVVSVVAGLALSGCGLEGAAVERQPLRARQPSCAANELVATSDAALTAAAAQFNAQQRSGLQWAKVDAVRVFDVSGCAPVELEAVVNQLAGQLGPFFADGQPMASTEDEPPFFDTSTSLGGHALHDAVDGFAGSHQAWLSSTPGPCHNCTELIDRVVVVGASSRRVVVLDGHHGFDS